ncbi:MAG: hypothetical protein GXO82_02780 [Chlorobi bacterium]|nr:hypothetical protein [Chlorobiota bacterium]
MNVKQFLQEAILVFVLTLVVSAGASYLYSLLVHGAGAFDWDSAFLFAIIFAIVLPTVNATGNRKKN